MPLSRRTLALAGLGAVAAVAAALSLSTGSSRDPAPDERSRLEAALRDQGYTKWDDIDFEDGRWEVDDAVHRDGKTYDLKLDPNSLRVVEREEDYED